MPATTTNTWICDCCHEIIGSAAHGWVEWISCGVGNVGRGLRLVHHCTAHPGNQPRCQYSETALAENEILYDGAFEDFLGTDGLIRLLEMIAEGELPTPDLLEMIKRLHVPGYEHARRHFHDAIAEGVIDVNTAPGYYPLRSINTVLEWVANRPG